jgi:hypothetical protein
MTKIHLVWLGPGPNIEFVAGVQSMNPGCEVMLHRDDSLLPEQWRPAYESLAKTVQQKSDLLRLSALRAHGGFYMDFDVLPLLPVSQIIEGWTTFTAPMLCNSPFITGDVLYCPADWPHWGKVDDYITNYSNPRPPYAWAMDSLFVRLPAGSFQPVRDCVRFAQNEHSVQKGAVLVRNYPAKKVPSGGPGTELSALLAGWPFRIKPEPGCPCKGNAAKMDARGCDWCEQNIGTITVWLREEAARRGFPYIEALAQTLVGKAIKRARAKGFA